MSKNNISATVDDDVYEFVQQDHINTSGLINRCLREYMNTGGDVSAVRDLRIKQLEDDAEDLLSRAENKREKAEELREAIEKQDDEVDESRREEQLKKLRMVPDDPEHMLVQQVADELNMTPEEAITEANNL